MIEYIWLVPLLPLIGFLLIAFNFKRFQGSVSGIIASSAIFVSFIISLIVFIEIYTSKQAATIQLFHWIKFNKIDISFSFLIDQLSALMLMIITGVGFLIHVYSIGYMKGDSGFNRFFAYMNLFVFFMLVLVLGSNYLIMFIGWEGVGLCSYLLIGFWFKKHENNNAAKKAFIMNRIGDLGFLLGIFLLFNTFGTLNFGGIFSQSQMFTIGNPTITAITLLLFVGAIGKSAQIPLFTWLPDAMAGPTPVSALIHAATMVTAGIYMIARSNVLFVLSPITLLIIAIVGITTALLSGGIAIFQTDIKKVLAYSTVSQLGFMFLALSVGAFTGAMFHLTTHAFFKALLFLAAGSVIHALNGEQDIRKMGGLKNKIPITFFTFLIGTIAISGIPPFSGFFSKDMILIGAFEANSIFWIIAVIVSLMTTFYMFRLLYIVFWKRSNNEDLHAHESPKNMTIPLMILATLSVLAGAFGIPLIFGGNDIIGNFLSPIFAESTKIIKINAHEISHNTELLLMFIPVIFVFVVVYLAYYVYVKQKKLPEADNQKRPFFSNIFFRKLYFDEIYNALFVKPALWLSDFLHNIIELKVIDRMVNQAGDLVVWTGKTIRYIQTGNVGFYLFAMVISIILILIFKLFI